MATSRAAAGRPAPTSLPADFIRNGGCPLWVYIGHTDGRHPLQEPQWCRADRCTSGRTRSCRPQIWLRAGEWATNREQAKERRRRRRHGPRLRLTTRHACKTRIGLAGATDGLTDGGREGCRPASLRSRRPNQPINLFADASAAPSTSVRLRPFIRCTMGWSGIDLNSYTCTLKVDETS